MHSQFEHYLHDVEQRLRSLPEAIRKNELREISAHLQQSQAELSAEGYSEEEAARIAIQRFGNPRRIGLKLRDVWEGNWSAPLTLLTVVLSGYLSFMGFDAGFYTLVYAPAYDLLIRYQATEIASVVTIARDTLYMCLLPLGWGFALGSWGGRRVAPIALLVSTPYPLLIIGGWLGRGHMSLLFPLSTYAVSVGLAAAGAWAGSTSMRRKRFAHPSFVPVCASETTWQGHVRSQAKNIRFPSRFIPAIKFTGALILLVLSLSWGLRKKSYALDHPSTPEAAARNAFVAPRLSNFKPATNVSISVLPATSSNQENSDMVRVSYSATMHVGEDYRRMRLRYYYRMLNRIQAGRDAGYSSKRIQAAILRLDDGSLPVQGVMDIRWTAEGWKVYKIDGVRGDLLGAMRQRYDWP